MIILRQKIYSNKEIVATKTEIKKAKRFKLPKFYYDYLERINPLVSDLDIPDAPYALKFDTSNNTFEVLDKEDGNYSRLFSPIHLFCSPEGTDFYAENPRRGFIIVNPKVVLHKAFEDILIDQNENLSNKQINLLKKIIKEIQKILLENGAFLGI